MPEESFEQQARKLAEQFSMEPQPVVWQRVKAAITPKRRRRAAFIWWVLMLGVVCSLGFWLMNNEKIPQSKEANAKQNSAAKENSNTTERIEKVNENAHHNLASHPIINSKQYNASVDKKDADFFVQETQSESKKKIVKQNADITLFQPETQFSPTKNEAKEKEAKTNADTTLIQSQKNILVNSKAATHLKSGAMQEQQNVVNDSAKTNTEIKVKTNDTLNPNKDSSTAFINKKKKKNKWYWGVTAEGGMSWLGNGLFGDQAKSLSDFSSVPTGMTNGGSQSFLSYQQRKNGVDVALGIAAKTNLSKRWFLDGELTYRYQQFSIQTTSFNSLPTPLNSNVIKSNMSYRFQSANIYAGIGLLLFHKKNASVALQAGVDQALLLSIKQMHNDSLQSLTAQGFQRWQPSLQFSIPIGIYSKRNIRWQLAPFIRWGLRGLQENGNGFAHHQLNAVGIKANYFFK